MQEWDATILCGILSKKRERNLVPRERSVVVSGQESQRLLVLPLELIQVLADMATDTEVEVSAMEARFQNCPGLYYRLNVERGLEEVSLEEWEKLGDVKQHTMAYLNDNAVSRRIDVIVDALVGKSQQVYPLGQLGI